MVFDYKAWTILQEKLYQFPPKLLQKTTKEATKYSKTYLRSRVKYNKNVLINAIVSRSTGEYENTIQAEGKASSYEIYVHDGRRSFSAKNKLALHWIDKSGKDVFVRKPKKVAAFSGYFHYKYTAEHTVNNVGKYARETLSELGVT